jgi:drug/metabolite transporter (DMT)-like permease
MAVATASLLAFAGAVCVAGQTIAIKHGSDRARETSERSPAFVAAFTTLLVSVVVFWGLYLAEGVSADATALPAIAPFVVAGALNPAAFRVLYFKGIDEVGAPIAAALIAMNPVVATIFAVPVLGETVTLATGAGIFCIVGGGIIIQSIQNAAPEAEMEGSELDLIARRLAAAEPGELLTPLAAMVILGLSYVLITVGLRGPAGPVTGLTVAQTTAFVGFLGVIGASRAIRGQLRSLGRSASGLFVLAGVFTTTAQIANFFALDIGTVATVIPLFNTFPLLVLAITYAIAREVPRSIPVLVGVVAIVTGSILVEVF